MSQVAPISPPRWKDLDWLRAMRDAEPVWRDPATGVWHAFRYADVAAILADHRVFGSDFAQVHPEQRELTEGNILAMDPPRHHRLRGLVSQAFTPRAIAELEPRIASLTAELLDQTGDRTELDLVADLAYPLPVIVIAEMLGVPAADRGQFKVWADALMSQGDVDPNDRAAMERAMVDLRRFHDYLRGHLAERREEPRADLLSRLVTAELDGQRLDDGEIVGFATILLLAGHITTTALLGNTLLCLDEHPEVADALRADPAAIPTAIEEVLRYRSPFSQTTRVTYEEVTLCGRVVPAKQMLQVWLLSANHDEREFERPDDFVMDRHPNPHVGFGKGIHFCIGAPLARLESRIALGVMLDRYASLRVDRSRPLEPYADPGINGMQEVHLVVERSSISQA